MITKKTYFRCNNCGSEWLDTNTEHPKECPKCQWEEESGLGEIISVAMDTIEAEFDDIRRYLEDRTQGIKDLLTDEIERILKRKMGQNGHPGQG